MLIKEVEIKKDRRKETVEEIFKTVGTKVEVKEIKKIKEIYKKRREIIIVRIDNEEQK